MLHMNDTPKLAIAVVYGGKWQANGPCREFSLGDRDRVRRGGFACEAAGTRGGGLGGFPPAGFDIWSDELTASRAPGPTTMTLPC